VCVIALVACSPLCWPLNNKSLRILQCNDNQLSQLDLSENTELAILICNSNNLDYLSLTNNTDLQVLRAHENSLTNLNLSTNLRLIGEMDDDVFNYFINGLWGALSPGSRIDIWS